MMITGDQWWSRLIDDDDNDDDDDDNSDDDDNNDDNDTDIDSNSMACKTYDECIHISTYDFKWYQMMW